MGKWFFIKMARGNLRRNRQLYLPYCIATAIMSAIFFIILNIVYSKGISNMNFGPTTVSMLSVGVMVMTIFTFSYMVYINSFLIKRRKKEFGLYAILGLEKRHVSRIIILENMMLSGASLAVGLITGTVFGRLIFMMLVALLNVADKSRFELSPPAYIVTALIFIGILIVTTLYNQLQVRLANPIDLINGEHRGEKKLRAVVPTTIFGAICIAGAYYFSATVTDSSLAILYFWPAVLLVIMGTWALFTAGSQFILHLLKKNKSIYYKPRNFISISGLTHRMKQNAAGLSNICILSTMVLVTVSGCSALFFGQENIVRTTCMNDYYLKISYPMDEPAPDISGMHAVISSRADESGVSLDSCFFYESSQDYIELRGDEILFKNSSGFYPGDETMAASTLARSQTITLDTFNSVTGLNETLEKDEVLVLSAQAVSNKTFMPSNGNEFICKKVLTETVFTKGKNSNSSDIFFVVADSESMEVFISVIKPDYVSGSDYEERSTSCVINFSGPSEARAAFTEDLIGKVVESSRETVSDQVYYHYESIDILRSESNRIYGGLLFLGIVFSILFLINTVLIIYFKQVSEGFDDRERFEILQKVGMSDDEVKRTINRQVLIVFFLPLAAAFAHILAASNLMAVGLQIFGMVDYWLVLLCVAVTTLIFALVYVFVFKITARTYYKLVKW